MEKVNSRKWRILMILVVAFWAGFLLSMQGCSLKNMVAGDATPADCAAIQAYITMANNELVKQNLSGQQRGWWELALAGAQIELARKCAGVAL